jgi:hypothetical protein
MNYKPTRLVPTSDSGSPFLALCCWVPWTVENDALELLILLEGIVEVIYSFLHLR